MLCFSALLLFLSSVNTLASSLGEKEPFPSPSLKEPFPGPSLKEPFPSPSLKEPFPSPSLKGREMEPFLQIFLEGTGDESLSSDLP